MHEDDKMALQSLKSCVPVAGAITYAFYALNHKSWALCYATGALLSLFSLFTLTILVPMLFRPGAHPSVKALLCITLFMKLPIYMFALYMMTRLAAAGAAASVVGIALAPMVITLKAVAAMVRRPITEQIGRKRRAAQTGNARRPVPAEGG